MASQSAAFDTSARTKLAPPAGRLDGSRPTARRRPRRRRRPLRAAPSRANSRALSRPMPLPAPVISATLSSSRMLSPRRGPRRGAVRSARSSAAAPSRSPRASKRRQLGPEEVQVVLDHVLARSASRANALASNTVDGLAQGAGQRGQVGGAGRRRRRRAAGLELAARCRPARGQRGRVGQVGVDVGAGDAALDAQARAAAPTTRKPAVRLSSLQARRVGAQEPSTGSACRC